MRAYLDGDKMNEILSKLFDAVGQKFVSIRKSCHSKQWYLQYEWTTKQQEKFEKWLKKYIMKNLHHPAKLAELEAKMFCFNHGWKYKGNTNAIHRREVTTNL